MPKIEPIDPRWMLEEPQVQRLNEQYPSLWNDPTKKCLTCMFEGKQDQAKTFLWWNRERTEVVEWECDCTSQWALHRYLLAHGIGKLYQRLSWADAEDVPEATQMATLEYLEDWRWRVERGVNLIFHSKDAGTGKTLMLMLLAKGLLSRGCDMVVVQMNQLVEMYSAGWKSADALAWFEYMIMNCASLGIDDLGKERSSSEAAMGMVQKLLDRVVRHRAAHGLPTHITSNFEPDQLLSGYGGYVMSLLTETCTFVPTSGIDFRPRSNSRMSLEIEQRLSRPLVMA